MSINYSYPIVMQPGQVLRDATITVVPNMNQPAITLADNCRLENVTVVGVPNGPRRNWVGMGIFGAGAETVTMENIKITGFGVGIMLDGMRSNEASGRISIEKTFIDANTGVYIRKITDNVWLDKVHVHPMLGVMGDGAATNYLYCSGPAFYISDRAETVNMNGCHSYGHPFGILIDNPIPEHAPSVRVNNFNAESYPDPVTAKSMGLPENSSAVLVSGECYLHCHALYSWGMESGIVVNYVPNMWGNMAMFHDSSLQNCYGTAIDLRQGEGVIRGVLGDKYAGNSVIKIGKNALFDISELRYIK